MNRLSTSMRRQGAWALVVIALLLSAAAWTWLGRRDASRLDAALRDYAQRRFERACETLRELVNRDPSIAQGEAAYSLGLCEQALGNTSGALRAWSLVPSTSKFATQAALFQARLLLQTHKFALAEPLLQIACGAPSNLGIEAIQTLAHILKLQGRFDEVVALFQANYQRMPDQVTTLRELWRLQAEPYPADEFEQALKIAAAASPEDDHVALGLANAAMLRGAFDEAATWIERCHKRRPRDPAVCRARLDLAVASGQHESALRALISAQMPAISARAWVRSFAIAEQGLGDNSLARAALNWLVEHRRANGNDLEQLAELEIREGRHEQAGVWRRRKAEYDRALPRYHDLLFDLTPFDSARELGALAEALGWHFEAHVWWKAAARQYPGASDAMQALRRIGDGRAEHEYPLQVRLWLSDMRERVGQAPSAVASRVAVNALVPPEPSWRDDATISGLKFQFDNGRSPARQLPETMSGGVALLDFDRDGWLDVYFVQGGPFPPDPSAFLCDKLFRNRGDGTFEDATQSSGISGFRGGYGHGVTVGDVNNDGYPDVFITRWRGVALYLNQGNGTFRDATEAWGLGGPRGWPTSAAMADVDGDGDLDIYVCNYVQWDSELPRVCTDPRTGKILYCPPVSLPGEADTYLRNEGDRFVEATRDANLVEPGYRGLGVVAADLDGDRLVDLFVANDMHPNLFFRNLGNGKFAEQAELAGLSSNADGGFLAGMGVALGDLGGDGRPDLAVTNFYGESTRLYRNLGQGQFIDQTASVGLLGPTRYVLGFGTAFLDVNNDGYLDLISANGHVDDLRPTVPHTMPMQLFLGGGTGKFVDATRNAGPALATERLARGLAVGDLDNDGRLDAVVVDQEGPAALLRNLGLSPVRNAIDHGTKANFVTFELVGAHSNRDAIGAEVVIEASGRRQFAWRFGGGSYQSASDPRLHFGLAGLEQIESVEVRWPSGHVDRHENLSTNRGYRLIEGSPRAERLPGFTR